MQGVWTTIGRQVYEFYKFYLVIQKVSQMKYVIQKKEGKKQINKQCMHIELIIFLAITIIHPTPTPPPPPTRSQQDDIAGHSLPRERIIDMMLIIPSDNAPPDPYINVTVSLRFRLYSDPYII